MNKDLKVCITEGISLRKLWFAKSTNKYLLSVCTTLSFESAFFAPPNKHKLYIYTVCPGSSYPNFYNELLYKMGYYCLEIW